MAKTKGPLLSLEAHGSLAKTLNYSQRKSGSQCRKYNKPLVTPSAAQRGQRRLTEFLVAQWQNMSDADKATWATNAAASKYNLAGYHYFLREAQRDLYTHHGLISYWSCNSIINNQILDLSGNGLHCTLQPTPPGDIPLLVTSRSDRFSNALQYNGSSHYASRAIHDKMKTVNAISLSVWIYSLENNAYQSIIAHCFDYAGENGGGLWKWNSNKGYFRLGNGTSLYYIDTNNAIPMQEWHYLVGTWDGTDMHIYLDGVQQASTYAFAGPIPYNLNSPILLGKYNSAYYNGKSDEICVYNRALSAAEILTRYNFAKIDV